MRRDCTTAYHSELVRASNTERVGVRTASTVLQARVELETQRTGRGSVAVGVTVHNTRRPLSATVRERVGVFGLSVLAAAARRRQDFGQAEHAGAHTGHRPRQQSEVAVRAHDILHREGRHSSNRSPISKHKERRASG
jgi:hypothetical protein